MGGFAEDAEADARFLAHKRYLAWRRRLLPLGAVLLFLLLWWQAVVQFDIKPFIAPRRSRWPRCWSSVSAC